MFRYAYLLKTLCFFLRALFVFKCIPHINKLSRYTVWWNYFMKKIEAENYFMFLDGYGMCPVGSRAEI